jgi:prevent-host-death family protein
MATIVKAMELHQHVGELLARVRYAKEQFIVKHMGKPVAALIGIEEYNAVREILEDLEDARNAEESLARYRENPEEFVNFDAYVEKRRFRDV